MDMYFIKCTVINLMFSNGFSNMEGFSNPCESQDFGRKSRPGPDFTLPTDPTDAAAPKEGGFCGQ